ncbi:MAG: serine/threonine-protein kinase [Acidobacteriota bacterium]
MSSRDHIDRYEIQGVLGRGSMGIVYHARDPLIGRELALKKMHPPEFAESDPSGKLRSRFARELKAVGRLSHPNIVMVYDAGNMDDEGASFIAMEYVPGQTLREKVPRDTTMPPRGVLDLAMQVARALEYAHAQGVVHRDVKPANILIRNDGLVKLADFGIARFGASELTNASGSIGSPSYVAPESLRGGVIDGRADLFSLGVVLYELLTGSKPFQAEALAALFQQVLCDDPIPPSERNEAVPADWDPVIARLLAKSPADRYPGAAPLLDDLRCLERGLPPGGDPTGAETRHLVIPAPRDRAAEKALVPAARRRRHVVPPHGKAMLALSMIAIFAMGMMITAIALGSLRSTRSSQPVALQPKAAPSVTPVVDDAAMMIRFRHNIKAGKIAVTMDGASILDESFLTLAGRNRRERRRLSRRVVVPAGKHRFEVTVVGPKDRQWTTSTTHSIGSGGRTVMWIELKGVFRRKLRVVWP